MNIQSVTQKALAALLVVTSLGVGHSALADGSESHGGDGLKIGNHVYPLDLVESGVEDNPYIDPSIAPDPLIMQKLQLAFDSTRFPVYQIAQKLTEIQKLDYTLSKALTFVMTQFNWNLVNRALVDVKDEEGSDVQFNPKDLVQLAIRRNHTILVDRDYWMSMDLKSRVALVFHEAVYASITPVVDTSSRIPGTTQYAFKQSSKKARDITGYLFSPNLPRKAADGLSAIIKGGIGIYTGSRNLAETSQANLWFGGPLKRVEVSENGEFYVLTPAQITIKASRYSPAFGKIEFGPVDSLQISGVENPEWQAKVLAFCQYQASQDLLRNPETLVLHDSSLDFMTYEVPGRDGSYVALQIQVSTESEWAGTNPHLQAMRDAGPFQSVDECVSSTLGSAKDIVTQVSQPRK